MIVALVFVAFSLPACTDNGSGSRVDTSKPTQPEMESVAKPTTAIAPEPDPAPPPDPPPEPKSYRVDRAQFSHACEKDEDCIQATADPCDGCGCTEAAIAGTCKAR